MIEDNGTAPQFPLIQVQITPDGQAFILSFILAPGLTLNAGLGPDMMNQVVRSWLEKHPELLQELAKESVEAKKRELQLIRHISSSRND